MPKRSAEEDFIDGAEMISVFCRTALARIEKFISEAEIPDKAKFSEADRTKIQNLLALVEGDAQKMLNDIAALNSGFRNADIEDSNLAFLKNTSKRSIES